MDPRFLTSTVSFEEQRSFDPFVTALRNLVPDHRGESLALTLLPAQLTEPRILTVRAHHHRDQSLAHWRLALEPMPAGSPPSSVVERSARLGGISGFIERLTRVLDGGPWKGLATIWFGLDEKATPCRFLPRPSRGPNGGRGSTFSSTWVFEPPAELSSLTLTRQSSGPIYLVGVEVRLAVAISAEMFATAEETACKAFGRTLKPKRKRGS